MSYTEDLEKSVADVFRQAEEEGNMDGLFGRFTDLLINEAKQSFRRGLELGKKQAQRRKPTKAWQA